MATFNITVRTPGNGDNITIFRQFQFDGVDGDAAIAAAKVYSNPPNEDYKLLATLDGLVWEATPV